MLSRIITVFFKAHIREGGCFVLFCFVVVAAAVFSWGRLVFVVVVLLSCYCCGFGLFCGYLGGGSWFFCFVFCFVFLCFCCFVLFWLVVFVGVCCC